MAGHKSPLRDRLFSNSPDTIKSSILRESGMGWNSPPSSSTETSKTTNSVISPLRIAKRESPVRSNVARRSSSSYKHVRNNNLVSKSPFKSQIPTPLTPSSRASVAFPSSPIRRVSGEKRPRPMSIHEQAEDENERPFSLKRERRQSKGFQGLIQKEPVTKSPFKRTPSGEEAPLPPLPPISRMSIPSFEPPSTSYIPTPTSNAATPTRSCLVSKRLHGPRLSGRRERRKTVIFDERCDVVEFDREEGESDDAFETGDDDDEEYGSPDPDPFLQGSSGTSNPEPMLEDEDSYESIELSEAPRADASPIMALDPDSSISGLVEEMFASNDPRHTESNTNTPPRNASDIPTDLETNDGVPLGRSHHAERFLQQHQHQHPSQMQSPPAYPFNLNLPTHASPQGPPETPPRRSPPRNVSTPPLGRSTHPERVRAAREEEGDEDEDVAMLPVSPSPRKKMADIVARRESEGLIPRFTVPVDAQTSPKIQVEQPENGPDPFAVLRRDESYSSNTGRDAEDENSNDDSMDPANLSIGHSEVSLGGLEILQSPQDSASFTAGELHNDDNTDDFFSHDEQTKDDKSPLAKQELNELAVPSRTSSPAFRAASPARSSSSHRSLSRSSSSDSRQRITKEDVKRRLLTRRSFGSVSPRMGSPATPESESGGDVVEIRTNDDKEEEKEKDGMSIITVMTDISAEMATIEKAEKRTLTAGGVMRTNGEGEFGFLGGNERLKFDFGSKFGLGGLDMGVIGGSAKSRESLGIMKGNIGRGIQASTDGGMKMGDVDVDMRSALDRLMDDVAGTKPDDSMMSEEGESYEEESSPPRPSPPEIRTMKHNDKEPALLGTGNGNGFVSRSASGSSVLTLPPPVPPKDNIRSREAMIIEKRREARRLEEAEDDDEGEEYNTRPSRQQLGIGRPSRRRSMSTGDAETMGGGSKKRGEILLDVGVGEVDVEDDGFEDSIERELKKLESPQKKSRYLVREREETIYASSDADRISHMAGPGDVNAGKAWRPVRRPSDMNEYSKQIKEYRAQEKPGKAYGKVFVKVLGVKGMHLPLPQQPTAVSCTLNNGIHFVTTPECQLNRDFRVEQEFELIEHSKLEFTLTLKVRRDPHIIAQFKAIAPAPTPAPPPPPPVVQSTSKGGMRSFFSSSPKKSKEKFVAQPPPPKPVQQRLVENLARYMKTDGTLARAFISFKDISSHCDTKLFETSYPLIGQRVELGNKISTLQVGEIVLQMFRLPPLPGIAPDQLPQSLEECHRGLRHINWHKVTYFEGTLTQSGGDCSTWRRRQLRVIGANLVAFNDVTKKATATIDLKKAIAVEDDQEARNIAQSPASGLSAHSSRFADEYDGHYGVERSFRLIFPHDQEIMFFADTDEEKSRWLDVLRALVGHIPPHPLWAELLWQRQDELFKKAQGLSNPHRSGPQTPPLAASRPQPRPN